MERKVSCSRIRFPSFIFYYFAEPTAIVERLWIKLQIFSDWYIEN